MTEIVPNSELVYLCMQQTNPMLNILQSGSSSTHTLQENAEFSWFVLLIPCFNLLKCFFFMVFLPGLTFPIFSFKKNFETRMFCHSDNNWTCKSRPRKQNVQSIFNWKQLHSLIHVQTWSIFWKMRCQGLVK